MFGPSVALASLLATSAFASMHPAMGGMLGPRETLLEARLGDTSNEDSLQRRQSNTLVISETATTNMTQWNTDTAAACESALSQLIAASNPSGTAVCYNLLSLDTNTGAFMADLRLFQVSTPFGDFEGIPPADIAVGLQYNGASVSPVQGNETANVTKRQSATPTLLQSYMFVGQIDKDRMAQPMTM